MWDNFAANLRSLMKERGLNDSKVGFALGISRQAVHQWRSGNGHPSEQNLENLCVVLDCKMADLLKESPRNDTLMEIEAWARREKIPVTRARDLFALNIIPGATHTPFTTLVPRHASAPMMEAGNLEYVWEDARYSVRSECLGDLGVIWQEGTDWLAQFGRVKFGPFTDQREAVNALLRHKSSKTLVLYAKRRPRWVQTFQQNFPTMMRKSNGDPASLGAQVGVHASSVQAWLDGRNYPRGDRLPDIAKALGVPLHELAGTV